jgi:hypothetical protein
MPDAQTVIHEQEDRWAQEPLAELPPRPRRRLLGARGAGGNPVALALLGVLLIAGGFIGGVLVEKGQTSSSPTSAAAGLASRLAALRGGATGTSGTGAGAAGTSGTGAGATGTSGTGAGATGGGSTGGGGGLPGGGFAGRFGGAGGGATIGEVAYISGDTLYVTTAEGNTVKVTTSPASSITKTVKAHVHGIHPGETVIVRGTKGSSGAVSAESVSVSAAGAVGGGLSSLFGGGGSRGGGAGGGGTGGGGAALFGG